MRIRKLSALLLGGIMIASALSGCGAPKKAEGESAPKDTAVVTTAPEEEKKDIVLAGIYKAGDQQWFIGEGESAKKVSMEMGAKDFLYIDAKMNPDTYLQALDNVIAQGVSGILVCTPDQKLSQVTVQKAEAAGIPVIAVDDPLVDADGKFIAPFVGIDAKAIGGQMAEWTADYITNNNWVKNQDETGLMLLTMEQVSSCVPRTEGQEEVWNVKMPNWPKDKVFKSDYNGETEKGFNAATGVITANPNIKQWIIMAPNDEGAAGATRALEQAGLDKDSIVIGLGGYLAKLEFQKEYSAFIASAFIDYVDIGASSAKELMENIQNKTAIPQDFRTPAKMVTKEDYKEIMGTQAE